MAAIKIRQYVDSDLEQCRTLWKELTQHHRVIYDDPSIGGDDPGHYFDQHLARVGPERLWVAVDSGRVVGLTGLIVEDEEAEVEPLVVTPKNRTKGIGHALVSYVIEEAKNLGVRYLNVRPVARNVRAVTFFYECGFSILGHINLFIDLKGEDKWESGPELFGCSFQY
jgi:N-acetylglutamate synthase-like GNAT family acetyltransferase